MSEHQYEFELAVRYHETDGQGVVHHANYLQYFELARIEMLKAMGHDYADLERDGVLMVVHSVSCRYHRPAVFGDTLRIQTTVVNVTMARMDHQYKVFRDDELLAEGKSTIACVDRQGNVRRMPEIFLAEW